MAAGMWVKSAYPPGDHGQDAQGRLRAVKRKDQRVVLSALGLWDDGHWEIVHWQIATGETAAAWPHCLGERYQKGRTDETTTLIISGGSKGLESALDDHDYGVPHQRGLFPKIKNLADHLVFDALDIVGTAQDEQALRQARQARKKAMLSDASAVYENHEEAQIRERAVRFRDRWQERAPEAGAAFFVDFDQTLASLRVDLPDALLSLVRTTKLLERFHREARRKQHDSGMFQSEHGGEVLWYLMAMRETAKQQALVQCNRCRL
jgi:transposase-like protein